MVFRVSSILSSILNEAKSTKSDKNPPGFMYLTHLKINCSLKTKPDSELKYYLNVQMQNIKPSYVKFTSASF